MVVNLSEAKAKLSYLIRLVQEGERIVIAKNNKPIADLVLHRPTQKRRLGLLKGALSIPEDFNEEDPEIEALFYGSEK
jgi:antitoxin (DNA-binding transcriptional repressor) of toxin-antitoxin stability system